jgi:membrane-associated phospholipid phosphatase
MLNSSLSNGSRCSPFGHDDVIRAAKRRRFRGGAALGLLLLAGAVLLDARVAALLDARSSPTTHLLARWVSRLGEGWVILAAGCLVAAALSLYDRARTARLVFLVTVVSLLTGATATVLRTLIGRTRPNAPVAQGVYGVWHDSHWILGKPEFASFPSGHAATVAGLAVAAWLVRRGSGLVAVVYAVAVSWSRLALGVHHFSDIAAAGLLAIVCAPWFLNHLGARVERAGLRLQRAWPRWRPGSGREPEALPKQENPAAFV